MATYIFELHATLIDGLNEQSEATSYLVAPDSTTLADIVSAANAWLLALDGVTDAVVYSFHPRLLLVLPGGLKSASGMAFDNSRITLVGNIDFDVVGSSRRYNQAIPGFIAAGIVNQKFDLTNAQVNTFQTLLQSDPVTLGFYSNLSGQPLDLVLSAYLSIRKARVRFQQTLSLEG